MPEADARTVAIRDAFRSQAESCRALGSPFVATLCDLAAERLRDEDPVGRHILAWPGDPSSSADAVPLRFAGALHALVIGERDAGLRAAYPPHPTDPDMLWQAVTSACRAHADGLVARLASPPQTNEVRRSAALLPGFLTIAARFDLPLVLSEVGASAGLNLHWDQYAYRLGNTVWGGQGAPILLDPAWTGGPPPKASLSVAERSGCDLRPVDPADSKDVTRLLSYLWADQADRMERTRAALAIAAASGLKVDRADAVAWLEQRLDVHRPGRVHVVYHTIAWQYLPKDAQERGLALIESAGRRATETAPLAHLSLEADGRKPGAALALRMWPSGEQRQIGRADFHGRWIDWRGWDARTRTASAPRGL